ncbi:hypothetical protein PZB75_12225 [Streptomyces sp. AM 4-1-1]|uniref:hypothetical protein n=1 Tax=Streptomyces sp. AM 4-1-1 TaxID=3028710 RepID=UPI0023BA2883|nr:hypothetical protein [Streptomyces sp. AM 4-1-1]WEH34068.1 hypothetical protein PZB75_12225 [Streptomyces sp. AM 4-1-1]
MGDTLPALFIPLLVLVGGVHAGCSAWWRRRHPAPPSPYTHQAVRLAERAVLMDAKGVIEDAHSVLGGLYGTPGERIPDGPAATDATTGAAASAGAARATEGTGPAGATDGPGHEQSRSTPTGRR